MRKALIIVLVIIGGLCGCRSCSCDSSETTKSPEGQLIPGGAEVQAQRKTLIEKLIARGVFTKVEHAGPSLGQAFPRVSTGTAWDGLTFEQKSDFVEVVYAYEFAGKRVTSSHRMMVWHTSTSRFIGHMNAEDGLQLWVSGN